MFWGCPHTQCRVTCCGRKEGMSYTHGGRRECLTHTESQDYDIHNRRECGTTEHSHLRVILVKEKGSQPWYP